MAAHTQYGPSNWYARMRQRLWRLQPDATSSVTLTHNRIYILPTRRGWAFALTLLLMLLAAMNYGLSLGYGVTFLFGGLVHAAMLHTFRNLSRLTIEAVSIADFEPTAFAGETLPFRLTLRNASAWARHALRVSADSGVETFADVASEGACMIELAAPARKRGRQALGRLTIESTYPLGLWRAWAYVHFPLSGLVYPKPERHAPIAPAIGAGAGARNANRGDDEFAALRNYQPGDPLSRVAWKAAARGMGLLTKEFEGSGGGDMLISWSLTPPQFDTEQRLSRLTAWVLQAAKRSQQFELNLPAGKIALGGGEAQRRKALALLALHGGGEASAAAHA